MSCKAGKISHVLCNSEMSTAHINSLLLTAPILNTLKLSDFCCIEFDAMKSRELSFMMQDHFKIPVSFSAALLRFYTAVGHQSIIPNLAVSLSYGDRNKLFWQLSTSDTDCFFKKANMISLLSQFAELLNILYSNGLYLTYDGVS